MTTGTFPHHFPSKRDCAELDFAFNLFAYHAGLPICKPVLTNIFIFIFIVDFHVCTLTLDKEERKW